MSDISTPNGYLTAIIEANPDLTPDELAGLIQDAGFVSIHHNIASQIADWLATEAETVIENGDVAEQIAYVPGAVGLSSCIEARDNLHDAPALWMRRVAGALEKGRYL